MVVEAGSEQVQDRGDERACVTDADPEHEGHDVHAPHHRRAVAGDAEAHVDLVHPRRDPDGQAGHGDGDRAEPRPGWPQRADDVVVDLLIAQDGGELYVGRRDIRARDSRSWRAARWTRDRGHVRPYAPVGAVARWLAAGAE